MLCLLLLLFSLDIEFEIFIYVDIIWKEKYDIV